MQTGRIGTTQSPPAGQLPLPGREARSGPVDAGLLRAETELRTARIVGEIVDISIERMAERRERQEELDLERRREEERQRLERLEDEAQARAEAKARALRRWATIDQMA